MISRHREHAGVAVRTGTEVRNAANAALDKHGWTMSEFLIACLCAVADRPERLLVTLRQYRPEPKPRGRPKREPTA